MNDSCNFSHCCNTIISSLVTSVVLDNGKANSKSSVRDPAGAVAYTICILTLFSSLIILLMVRAIKPREDEQVTTVLCMMRVRIDREENKRRQNQLKEAKKNAQKWLGQLASRRLSFRRTNSDNVIESVRSLPLRNLKPKTSSRTQSYQGYLPEIVVTGESIHNRKPSKSVSRQSSVFSYDDDTIEDSFLSNQ